jgi:hypothetical protein
MINFPEITPSEFKLSFEANTRIYESPINRVAQAVVLPGGRWIITLKFNNIGIDKIKLLNAFIMQCEGQANRFSIPIPLQTVNYDVYVKEIQADNITVSDSTHLNIGDYFSIRDELKIIINKDDDKLYFKPPFRNDILENDYLKVKNPSFMARLSKDSQALIQSTALNREGNGDILQTVIIDCIEAF